MEKEKGNDLDRMTMRRSGEEPTKSKRDKREEFDDFDNPTHSFLHNTIISSEDDYEEEEDDEDDGAAWWFKPLGIVCVLLVVLLLIVVAAVLVVRHNNGFNLIVPASEETGTVEKEPKEETEKFEEDEKGTEKENDSISEDSISKNSVSKNDTSSKSKPEKQPTETATSSKTRKPIKVTVKISSIKAVYGASPIALSYDVEGVKKENLSKYITLTRTPGNNVGQYPITGTCSAPNLYDVTFIPGTYTIIPREVTIQVDNKESFVGEKLKDLTYTVSKGSIVKGDKVVSLSTNADASKVGTYKIEGKCINSNYNLTVKVGKYTVKAQPSSGEPNKPQEPDKPDKPEKPDKPDKPEKPEEVQKKKATVQLVNASSVYGEPIIDNFDFEVVSGELTKSELTPYIRAAKGGEGNTVGDYTIIGSCSNSDWDVTVLGATYTITPRSLSVKADDKQTYEGDPLADLTYTLTSGSIVNGDDVISLSTAATPSEIGDHTIIVECKNSNYALQSENGTYRVKAKPKPPKDEGEEVENPPDGPEDDEEDVKPNQPTPSDTNTSNGPSDESEKVQPSTPTP